MSHESENQTQPTAAELALLDEVQAALRTERSGLPANRSEFKAKLMARIERECGEGAGRASRRGTKVLRPTSWTRHLKYYAAAMVMIGMTLGLLAMSGLVSLPKTDHGRTDDILVARMTADPIPLAMSGEEVTPGKLFQPYDNQKMMLVIDSTENEACLALIPQVLIDTQYNELEKQALANRPHWDVTVQAGRVILPVEAYTKALGSTRGSLLLLKVGGHFEIWTAEALQRYRERGRKSTGIINPPQPVVVIES